LNLFDRAKDVAKSEPLPLVVVGEGGGTGQSSLLAQFSALHAINHPSDIIISHCILFIQKKINILALISTDISASSDSAEITNI
jgi:hypothetical protein